MWFEVFEIFSDYFVTSSFFPGLNFFGGSDALAAVQVAGASTCRLTPHELTPIKHHQKMFSA